MSERSAQFVFIPVGSPMAERSAGQLVDELVAGYIPALEQIGGRRRGPEAIAETEPLLYFVATGGTEHQILALRQERNKHAPGEPVLLLAHPGNNSLPAALEVLARLQQEGGRGRILYLNGPDDEAGLRQIARAAGDAQAFHRLRRARIGLVGEPSGWLAASRPDPDIVKNIWGPEVVPIRFEALEDAIGAAPERNVTAPLDALISKAAEVREPPEKALKDAVRVYLAVRQLVDAHRLDAVTVRCFDLVEKHRMTGCFALARLNDEGVVAGCEGDLVSTTGLLWLQTLLGQTAWMANPARIDEGRNTLWLAHCMVPLNMTAGFSLRSHFESGLGVSIQGTLKKEAVTLVRIGGRKMDRLWLAEGDITGAGKDRHLCRTQVSVQLTNSGQVSELLRRPLGNHLLLVPGRHADRLRGWHEMTVGRYPG